MYNDGASSSNGLMADEEDEMNMGMDTDRRKTNKNEGQPFELDDEKRLREAGSSQILEQPQNEATPDRPIQ